VIADMNRLLAICVSMGDIAESCHIDHAAVNVRNELQERLAMSRMSFTEIERIIGQKVDLRRRRTELFSCYSNARWKGREADLENERETKSRELQKRYTEVIAQLDEDFNSEQGMSEFNQPSPELIDLRRRARLDPSLAPEAAAREERETRDAERRRDAAYQAASNRLRKRFTQEHNRLRQSYETQLSDIQNSMNADLEDLNEIIKRLEARKGVLHRSGALHPTLAKSVLPRLVPR
jgi:hypothetical protein